MFEEHVEKKCLFISKWDMSIIDVLKYYIIIGRYAIIY